MKFEEINRRPAKPTERYRVKTDMPTCCSTKKELKMTHQYTYILPPSWKGQVAAWLAEDTPSFDYAGFVVGEAEREAFLFGKGSQQAILAGCPFFAEVFKQLDCSYVIYFSLNS